MQRAIPQSLLEERRRLGHDRFDEVWEGVLHMVPVPSYVHHRIEQRLARVLEIIAEPRGLVVFVEWGLNDPKVTGDKDYRVPDIAVFAKEHASMRGIEGVAELVVEVISPNDESRDKLPFYARVGVREVWLLDPAKQTIEVFTGTTPVPAVGDRIAAPSLGVTLRIENSTLHVEHGGTDHEVDIRNAL